MFRKFLLFFFITLTLSDLTRCESNKTNYERAIPVQSSLSRIISNYAGSASMPRIKFETYKALAGETIRLECPQPNPTWFFRRVNNDKYSNEMGKATEDIIVTRHGIINADYKYKIMCHMTLKHKVIIINNIEFDEEGVYTCLYTLPNNNNDLVSNNMITSSNDNTNFNSNLMQYRHVFNVTVYTLISGLTVNIKPISMRLSQMLSSADYLNKQQHQQNGNQIELVDSTLTVRENEEFLFNCVVDSSKPAAEIKFSVLNLNDNLINLPEQMSPSFASSQQSSFSAQPLLASLVSSNTNVVKNTDKTFKTVYAARLKANLNDHGKTIACTAENGFSNQKWENKKTLNVLFAPICYHKPNYVYFTGINQTLNVECKILNANPARVSYKWDLNGINGNINFQPNNLVKSSSIHINNNINELKETNINNNIMPQAQGMLNMDQQSGWNPNLGASYYSSADYNKIYNTLETDSMTSKFQWKPTGLNDFGEIKCIATNEIGSTECTYELKLGGVPNPPTDCNYILKNTSAIISCQVGFHQGDPDIYCYLLRKSDNGVYKEHTRNRESCSFIVNDINLKKFNEFWIYSSNKHGHNKDNGVHLTIGEQYKEPEPTNNKFFIIIAIGVGLVIFVFLACCFCFKIRKSFLEDNDSVYDTDAYQPSKHQNNSNSDSKKGNPYPTSKMIKGVKVNTDSSYDINDHIKDVKIIKPYNPRLDGTLNAGFSDNNPNMTKKRESYSENSKSYLDYSKVTSNRHERPSYQQQFVPRNRLDDRKLKFNLFKSTSTLPSNRVNRYEVKHLSVSNLKANSAQSYTNFDKLNNDDTTTNNKSISNSALNDSRNLKMKKSISFTKSTQQNNLLGLDDPLLTKETTPFFAKEKNSSLLTTVAASSSNAKLIHSKLSSNSINSLSDTNLTPSNAKMVTFGASSQSRINKYPKTTNQSITTLTTAIVSTTTTTTGTNSESSNDASNNTSTTSPTCSSSNHDSEFLEHSTSPVINNSDLTSFNSSSLILPKLNTFQSNIISNKPTSNLDKNLPQSPKQNRKSNELIETKFLNKLCEEIEVSLNVDCECADDYSSNDFSGDYSFDNDLVIRPNNLTKLNQVNKTNGTAIAHATNNNGMNKPTNVNYLTDLRRNFELNIKQMRGKSVDYSRPRPPMLGTVSKQNAHESSESSSNNSSNINKTNIGVLV